MNKCGLCGIPEAVGCDFVFSGRNKLIPVFEEKHLVESEKEYPVSFNGKMRFTIKLPLDLTAAQIEEIVMTDERTQAQLQGRTPNKVIIVPGKIINLVG